MYQTLNHKWLWCAVVRKQHTMPRVLSSTPDTREKSYDVWCAAVVFSQVGSSQIILLLFFGPIYKVYKIIYTLAVDFRQS